MPPDHKLRSDSDASARVAGITLRGDGALTIDRVKKDDEGLYECVATNEEGVARTSSVITVIGRSQRYQKKKSTCVTALGAAAV